MSIDNLWTAGGIASIPLLKFSILAIALIVDLPSAQTAEPEQSVQLNIIIESNGKMFLDRQPIELDDLKAALTKKIKPNSESMVIINADTKDEHGTVVKVDKSITPNTRGKNGDCSRS